MERRGHDHSGNVTILWPQADDSIKQFLKHDFWKQCKYFENLKGYIMDELINTRHLY